MLFSRLSQRPSTLEAHASVHISLREMTPTSACPNGVRDDPESREPFEREETKISYSMDESEDEALQPPSTPSTSSFGRSSMWPSILSCIPSLRDTLPFPNFLRDRLSSSARRRRHLITLGKRPELQVQIQKEFMMFSGSASSACTPDQTTFRSSYPPCLVADCEDGDNGQPHFNIYASSGLSNAAPWTVRDKIITLSANGFSPPPPQRRTFVSKDVGVRDPALRVPAVMGERFSAQLTVLGCFI
ncbi:uncharacterized protein EI90DRAFT_3047430 [Cantharellus anzutake]|uniref:uncharacterized protein n=1 Tax=Cantharellus anzutake TaxID=1750568 RepID=UPI0019043931|nr:uncharacterized protein EI90DRAFT_3047430 [Cantharellus anzutake]KAF8335886.1 hypothetical protein EI90DRAFT_3047430 [Cantharellus anzutake]